jgi:hypothetical protein
MDLHEMFYSSSPQRGIGNSKSIYRLDFRNTRGCTSLRAATAFLTVPTTYLGVRVRGTTPAPAPANVIG